MTVESGNKVQPREGEFSVCGWRSTYFEKILIIPTFETFDGTRQYRSRISPTGEVKKKIEVAHEWNCMKYTVSAKVCNRLYTFFAKESELDVHVV